MNKHLLVLLATIVVSTGCRASSLPIADVVAASDKWNQQSVSMEGRLCVDLFTIYLASTDECDEIKEEQNGGFRIPLELTKKQFDHIRTIKSGTPVVVIGVFRIPPPDAIRMTRGILHGYSIVVSSVEPTS